MNPHDLPPTTPAGPARPLRAVLVNANKTHPAGRGIDLRHINGRWPLRPGDQIARPQAFLEGFEVLVATANRHLEGRRRPVVIAVRWIEDWHLNQQGNRVTFTTRPALELEHLLGGASPHRWVRGDGWPVKGIPLPPAATPGNGHVLAA